MTRRGVFMDLRSQDSVDRYLLFVYPLLFFFLEAFVTRLVICRSGCS